MRLKQRFFPYGVAIGTTAIALFLTLCLEPLLSPLISSFFYVAVILTAWYGGAKPGTVAVILSTLAITYFLISPDELLALHRPDDLLRFLVSFLVGFTINFLTSQFRDSKHKLESLSEQLAQENTEALEALKASQRQLQQQLAEIETIYRSAPIGLNVLDTNLRFVRINQRLAEMNGFSIEEHLGRTVRQLLPDLAESAEQLLQSILETGEPQLNIEISGETPAQPGVHRTWLEHFLPLKDGDKIIGISTVCEEITERKQAQLVLQELNETLEKRVKERTEELTQVSEQILFALLEKERTYQLVNEQAQLLDLAHDSIITWDLNSIITFWNKGSELIYGWTAAEALGQEIHHLLKTQSSQDLEEIKAELYTKGYWEGELIHWTKDNRQITILSRWVAQKDDTGKVKKILEINNNISERKYAEQALQESEEKFRQLAENIQAVFWITDLRARQILYVSKAYETVWQRKREEVYQNFSSWLNAVHPHDRELLETAFAQQKKTGRSDTEYRIIRTDGSQRWIRDRAFPIQDENGNIVRLAGIAEDITNRKKSETVLLQKSRQEQLLLFITQAIRQSLNLTTILNTAVTQIRATLEVDRAAVYRFNSNWSGDFIVESVGDEWVKLVEPGVCRLWEDTYLQEKEGGRFRQKESFIVHDIYTAGLQPCHIELLEQFQARSYAVFPIFSGESLWGLLAIYQNSTPRSWEVWEIELLEQIANQLAIALQQSQLYKQLKVELEQREKATFVIQEAERRWRSLLDNVQLIVVGLDLEGNVNYVNPFFLKLAGYTPPEVLGKNWFANFIPPEIQPPLEEIFGEVLTQNAYPYHRNAILTKSGEELFIAWNNTMLEDGQGNIVGTISIGEDISERQRVEKIKDEFIGVVSHELRTPLTAIQMSLGLLQSGIYDHKPQKFQRMLEIALLDTNRLVNLVNDILDLERLESGQAVLEKSLCRAEDLMRQAVEGISAIATQHQITLTLSPTNAEIVVAPDALIQTLTNLLSNAIKFSPPHSTIYLSAETRNDHVLWAVKDQGRGIPPDKLELIFGRFQQVDASDSREKGGTGLGLPICCSIIERHGGKIWAKSILGEGSSFFFTLPLPPTPDQQ